MQLPQTMSHLSQCGSMLPLAVKKTTSPRWARHFFRHLVCFSSSSSFPPLSTVSMMTCDLQVNQSQPECSTRRDVWIWGSEQENLSRNLPTAILKKNPFYFYIIAAYVRRVCICCLWRVDIAVQCCQFPVFSEMLQWFREEENIQRTYFGWTCHWWVCSWGVLIQYNVMRRRSTAIRGRGEVKKSSPHGTEDLLFSSSSSLVLLWGLGRCALRLAVLSGGGFAAPGGVVAQSRGAVEVVLVVQAVSGVVLRVLQTSDQTLILVAELAAHQGRLAHHHHVLEREADTKEGGHKCCCKKVTPCLSCVALPIPHFIGFLNAGFTGAICKNLSNSKQYITAVTANCC